MLGFLLLLLSRSAACVIPLTAAVMNVLAAGAAFGVVVAIFQWGWGSDAIGLGPGRTDRIVPARDAHRDPVRTLDGLPGVPGQPHPRRSGSAPGDNHDAIRTGQAATGRVITAAAAIMVFVFLAFVLEGRRPIGEFGLGLAAAILLDALLLRTVLVPAAMHLLGDAELVAASLARPGPTPRLRRPLRRPSHGATKTRPSTRCPGEHERNRNRWRRLSSA